MTEALRTAGHRITPQRLAVLKILAKSEGHPDAGWIHQAARRAFPSLSLATVYKTLEALKDVGQVLELQFSGKANRFDGKKPAPHPHVICNVCGLIVDPETLDLARIVAGMRRETGFAIRGSRVDFFGTCPDCLRRGRA